MCASLATVLRVVSLPFLFEAEDQVHMTAERAACTVARAGGCQLCCCVSCSNLLVLLRVLVRVT